MSTTTHLSGLFARALIASIIPASIVSATVTNGFTGPFSSTNWFPSFGASYAFSDTNFDFIPDQLVINAPLSPLFGNHGVSISSPPTGTVSFSYSAPISGSGYTNGIASTPLGGMNTVSNVSVGSLVGTFGFFNNSTLQSLTINNFSFDDSAGGGGPTLSSDLQVSPQLIQIAKLVQPGGSFVTTPVSVTNAGPNTTNYTVSDNNSTTAITRIGGAGTYPIASGVTQTPFDIRVATDTLGSFQSNHQAFNTGDTNDNNETFDNRVYVEAYINRAPMPIAHLGNLGSYNPNGDLTTTVDQGAGAVKTKSISFENLFVGTFQAQQKWLSDTVSNPAFTHTALFDPLSPDPYGKGDYQLPANFRKATTFSFDTTGKLNGNYTATYSTVWGLGYASASNVLVDASNTYTVNVQLSAVVTGNTTGTGSAPLGAGQTFSSLGIIGNPSAGSLAPTEAKLLEGSTSNGTTVNMQIVTPSPAQLSAFGSVGGASDVLALSGTGNDVFVLQMNYDPSALSVGQNEADLYLAWWNGLGWANAVSGNTPNTIYTGSPFLSSYAVFRGSHAGTLGNYLGAYGVDVANNTVWAVLNHNSDFSANLVPEPFSMSVLGIGAVGLLRRHRRRRAR